MINKLIDEIHNNAVEKKINCDVSKGECVGRYSKSDALCWSCLNTDQDICDWFLSDAVMPSGCRYRLKKGKGDYPDAYIITYCPNFVGEGKFGVKKPRKLIILNDDKKMCAAYPIVSPIRWALNETGMSQKDFGAAIGLSEFTVSRIVSGYEDKIRVKTHNTIANYINRLLEG